MNQVSLSGRLGADPEEFAYSGDKRAARFRLAVNRPQKDAPTDWIDVTVFEPSSLYVLNFMTTGAHVGVEGRLQEDTWEKDGQKRSKVKVIAHRVEGLESKREREAAGTAAPAPAQQRQQKPVPVPVPAPAPGPDIDWTMDEDEEPFEDQ